MSKPISIRPFEVSDMPTLKQWFYSGDYPEFFRDMLALTEEQLKIYAYMKDGQGFIIWDNVEPVGFVILYEMRVVPSNIKLAILVDKYYQEKGICLSAMIEMCKYVFHKLRMEKLIVEVLESNDRIKELAEKGGLEYECTLKNEANVNGKMCNVIRYCLYKNQFEEIMKGLLNG
jgi:RimJ/RimL family protein N-acetyltransferase